MGKTASYHAISWPFSKRAVQPLIGVFVLFYLGFHAVSGERGVLALFTQSHKLATLKAELEIVSAKRIALERKVQGLSDASLDLDLLDEQARIVLGTAGKNEIVYFLDDAPQQ